MQLNPDVQTSMQLGPAASKLCITIETHDAQRAHDCKLHAYECCSDAQDSISESLATNFSSAVILAVADFVLLSEASSRFA